MSLALLCDVIVVGGGAAGTAAAIGAASAGAQTVLVESARILGGAATLKNVLTYCGHWHWSLGDGRRKVGHEGNE
jgi:succinate dehydrogenase/fumarate reductase flavoprotein subunit